MSTPWALALVFLGGGTGSVLRYAAQRWLAPGAGVPWGTLLANVTACLVLGVVVAWPAGEGDGASSAEFRRLLWATGLCGGLSTFSSWVAETVALWQHGQPGMAMINAAASVALGLGGLWVGMKLGGGL